MSFVHVAAFSSQQGILEADLGYELNRFHTHLCRVDVWTTTCSLQKLTGADGTFSWQRTMHRQLGSLSLTFPFNPFGSVFSACSFIENFFLPS